MRARRGTWRALGFLMGLWLVAIASAQGTGAVGPQRFEVPVYLFWGEGCPHCATQKLFLTDLVEDQPYVVVYDFEVYYVPENRPLFEAMAAAFGRRVSGVPMTFIGDEVWTGYSAAMGREMRAAVERYSNYRAPDPVDRVDPELRPLFVPTSEPPPPPPPPSGGTSIDIPLVGAVDLGARSLWLSTALIALVDGFNPG